MRSPLTLLSPINSGSGALFLSLRCLDPLTRVRNLPPSPSPLHVRLPCRICAHRGKERGGRRELLWKADVKSPFPWRDTKQFGTPHYFPNRLQQWASFLQGLSHSPPLSPVETYLPSTHLHHLPLSEFRNNQLFPLCASQSTLFPPVSCRAPRNHALPPGLTPRRRGSAPRLEHGEHHD